MSPESAEWAESAESAESAGHAMAIVDAFGRVKAVSGGFSAALRVRRESIFSQPLSTVVRTVDRPALAHAIAAVSSGDWPGCSLVVQVLQHARADRAVRLVLEADAPPHVRIHATDLSAELEASRTLEEYEAGLRALTAHSLDIWALLKVDGVVRSVSDSVSVHLGWTPGELEGHRLQEFVHPMDVAELTALLVALEEDPSLVRSTMFRARHRSGGWRTLESTTSGFNPSVLGNSTFVINARDVTSRERTEATLREVEYRFSKLVEQANTGIVVIQKGRLVYANPRFIELSGLEPGAASERPRVLRLIDRHSIPALRSARDEASTGAAGTFSLQLRGRHTSGRAVEVEVATSVVDFEGLPALLCTVTDMTEFRASQLRMAEAEKVTAVGLLAGGVAHDFNNMLTGVLAWVDIAAEDVDESSPVRGALDEIRSAAEKAAELTRQLLAYGRRQRLEPLPLDLGEVVVRLKRWMDRVLSPNHRLEVEVPDAPWLVEADRTQIERALTALIMNAQEAMPDGGEIRVAVTNDVLEAELAERLAPLESGDHVVVSVRDTGVGMDDATRRRIFEPFFTTKSLGSGSGLGLPAVLGTILQSGGAIDVVTEVAVGTDFRCYLPRRADRSTLSPGPRNSPGRGDSARYNVLVVEDDPQLGKVLRRILRERGHDVRLAAGAPDGEELALATRPDVVVCDVGLPGMPGSAFAGSLRSRGLTSASVLISGQRITDEQQAEAGSDTLVLHKPFRPKELIDAVERAARRGADRLPE